jgi:transposase-like protein
LKELRAVIERERTAGGQLRRPARTAVVEMIERAQAQGTSYREIASALGVKLQTLMSWRSQEQARPQSTTLVPVRVSAPARIVVVHGPCGLRVEGLSLDELAALWSRLSS